MMLLVVSDSHGNEKNIDRMLQSEGTPDMLIHLGDVCGGGEYIQAVCGCPVMMVAGNNDFYDRELPSELVITVAGQRILLTHGHCYLRYGGYDGLIRRARETDAQIVMFGHTHKPVNLRIDDITIINPGSISYPRQKDRSCTYMVIDVSETGVFSYKLKSFGNI